VRPVAPEQTSSQPGGVEVRRSARRKRTVSAYRDGDRTVVLLPARMSASDERRWVALMLERLHAREQRGRRDTSLIERATALSRRYLNGKARPASVSWVDNQASRWGSCTPGDGSIRLSSRLQGMPSWVVDYVIVHELAHLLEARHGPDFWALVERYPRTERARGYLLGVAAAAGLKMADDDGDVEP
jgi:predicted metal-dependent hydrolase